MDSQLEKIHLKLEKIENWELLSKSPKVSILMATYNHQDYIKKALDSILMQEVDFTYEIIIKEDKSTDETRKIVIDYQKEHPDKIRLWLAKENLYNQGLKPRSFKFARGEYIAVCEGDDYWIDKLKLRKQLDCFEKNPSAFACFTNAVLKYNDGSTKLYTKLKGNQMINPSEVLRLGGALYPSASLMYRNKIKDWPEYYDGNVAGDRILTYVLLNLGDFFYLDIESCVYRIHGKGIYTSILNNNKKLQERNIINIKSLIVLQRHCNPNLKKHIPRAISKQAREYLKKDKNIFSMSNIKFLKLLSVYDFLRLIKFKILKK